ncbi:MAG TPA: hypothetical protein VFX30_11265 [bacterium]|nr:hypothetical protein [bacterium]
MNKLLGIIVALVTVLAASSTAFAKDSQTDASAKSSVTAKSTQNETVASTDLGFAPDGLAKDVMNLMTGVSRPIDGTTNFTVQAGKELRIGLTF